MEVHGIEFGEHEPAFEIVVALLELAQDFGFRLVELAHFHSRNRGGVKGHPLRLHQQRRRIMRDREQPRRGGETDSHPAAEDPDQDADRYHDERPEDEMRFEVVAVFFGDLFEQHVHDPDQRESHPPRGQQDHAATDVIQHGINPITARVLHAPGVNENPEDHRDRDAGSRIAARPG